VGADLIVLTGGRLLMEFSRWLSGAHDNDASEVVGIVSDDSGETWSEPFDIVKPDATVNAVRMPHFLRLNESRLACFCRYRTSILDTWPGMITCLDESRLGETESGPDQWTTPKRISPPPPGRHVLLKIVWLVCRKARPRENLATTVLRSDDDGETWLTSETNLAGPERGLMEPYIVELEGGRLRIWMRTQIDSQYESTSDDGGVTWSEAVPRPLVSPKSPVAIARHKPSSLLAVIWNHNKRGNHTADRTPICIAYSENEGDSWFGEQKLDPAEDLANKGCSFSYPSIDFLGDQGFITCYENQDRRISLVLRRFDLME
jgi:hypothetical protein